jgi:hypothetical protein
VAAASAWLTATRPAACCGPVVVLPVAQGLAPRVGQDLSIARLARSPAVASRPMAALAPGQAEVCGYGTVQLAPDDPDPVQRIPAALRQSALDQLDARMLASEDVQVRAAALWMGARLRGREVGPRVEQMVRLAVASTDPFVYAIAMEACRGRGPRDSGPCALLSPAQWVRLDPDNAVPWRALAAEAHEREEAQAEDMALQLAAHASRADVHAGRLAELVDQALGAASTPLQRTLALSAGWSADATWRASHGLVVMTTAQGMDLSCDGVERQQRQARAARR